MAEAKDANAQAPGGRRRRSPPRAVAVERVEPVAERLIRVAFTGDQLATFTPPKPGAHIKLLFVPEGTTWSPEDENAPRPPSRTYTPRFFDADARRLEVEFVLHGGGLADDWVQTAKPGDPMFVGGPGGGYDVPEDATHIVIAADETAMPAAGMVLEALPAGCAATVLCEVADEKDERPLSPSVPAEPTWLHRGANGGATQGTLLERAVAELEPPEGAYWWIACEAGAMRRIRQHLLAERGIDKSHVHTRGYWQLGESNHPDHDYGED